MRLHIVTDTYSPDSNTCSPTLSSWTNYLQQQGHEIQILISGKTCSNRENSLPPVLWSESSELRLGTAGKGKLKKLWSLNRPDILYIATASTLGISAIKAGQELDIPMVIGTRPPLKELFPYSLFSVFEKNALKYFRKHFNKAGLTLVPSEEIRTDLVQSGFHNVKIQQEGVDTSLYSPLRRDHSLRADWGVRKKTSVIGISGPATEDNLMPVFQILYHLQEEGHDLMGVVLGDGPSRDELAAHYKDMIFLPALHSEMQATVLSSLDFLIHSDTEGNHTSDLLKAMSSGLISISYENSFATQLIIPDENGYLVKGNNPLHLQKEIEKALSHISQDSPLRQNARKSVSQLTWEHSAECLEAHLQEVIAQHREGKSTALELSGSHSHSGIVECESVFLSDIHLGTPDSKADEAVDLLKRIRCRKIFLVGDIIDAWALRRGGTWNNKHSRFIRTLLKKMEKEDCEIIYIRGNHDEILEKFIPLSLGKLKIRKEYIHQGQDGKNYLVTHGDGFDSISTNHKWLAVLGSAGYDFLLAFNRYYNWWRSWRGKEYYSLSKVIKSKVKSAVSYIGRYEEQLQCLAEHKKCHGIICGHIHSPADKMVGTIRYLNCGDWVESLSCVLETREGDFLVHTHASSLK